MRGKNLGKHLLSTFHSWAQERDATTIKIRVDPKDRQALSFWKKHKYKETTVEFIKNIKPSK